MSLKVPSPPSIYISSAILHLCWITFPFPIHIELISEIIGLFSFHDASIV